MGMCMIPDMMAHIRRHLLSTCPHTNCFQREFDCCGRLLASRLKSALLPQNLPCNLVAPFILDICVYHPNSPVNLLSKIWLAEKFLDLNGNPDEETWIKSRYLTHVLTWSVGQFKKMFPIPVSASQRFFLTKDFTHTSHFCMQAHSSYMNTVTNLNLRQANL
jgi:hypothetical protein